MAPCVGAEPAVVVEPARRRAHRRAVEGVAALAARHETLDNAGSDRAAGSKTLIGLKPLFRQSEGLRRDNRRYRDLDPFRPWPLLGTFARRDAATQTFRAGDALSRRRLRLAVTGRSLIGRVAQHGPDHRSV